MNIDTLDMSQVIIILVIIVGALFGLIRHLISFSYSQQMIVKQNEAKLIESTIKEVVSDFKAQVETLKNDIKFISISFKSYQESTTKIIDKIQSKTEENMSYQDKLLGKLEYLEKHSNELDKKIEEKVKLFILDTSKI